jgi:transcription termination factor Rho
MTRAELEAKHLSELHALAAEAGVPRYRMLRREELVEKLASGGRGKQSKPQGERAPSRQRQRRSRDGGSGERRERPQQRQQRPREERPKQQPREERPQAEATGSQERPDGGTPAPEGSRRPRRRRRLRFGRKRKELRLHEALLPRAGGHAIAYAETREACTTLLREFAAELSDAASGSDPVVLLIDPGPEELAEWRRNMPKAEIVAAAQARHAEDALSQAARRAAGGESVIVLIDSLTRFVEAFKDAGAAKSLLDIGRDSGSLTVVAALERR